jgi:hypothetical protein
MYWLCTKKKIQDNINGIDGMELCTDGIVTCNKSECSKKEQKIPLFQTDVLLGGLID